MHTHIHTLYRKGFSFKMRYREEVTSYANFVKKLARCVRLLFFVTIRLRLERR